MKHRPLQRSFRAGIERLPAQQHAQRHQHRDAYVTVVLEGAYEQAAYAGRLTIGPADVIIQPSFDCHADRMMSAGVELLRLPWGREIGLGGVIGGCPVEEIRRAARVSVIEAVEVVRQAVEVRVPRPRRFAHLCDKLAEDLAVDHNLRIGRWAAEHGRSREAVSREFRAFFGVSPERFRIELRARAAWGEIVSNDLTLSQIAYKLGFADQAHMTRAVSWLTGLAPSAWSRPHHRQITDSTARRK